MSEPKHDGLTIPGRVVLAHEAPFLIGKVNVEPSTRQIAAGDIQETVEPRVMQAFVALAKAQGSIVTRDELIERCWDGRIVTDDAINRVLSRIRQLGSGVGDGSFTVETITKVGYRLVVNQHSASVPALQGRAYAPNHAIHRRAVVASAAAIGATALAGGLLWKRPWRHRPPAEALEMYRRGDLAQRAGRPDQVRQAVTYFERAVSIDPQYGEGWGALALAYTHNLDGYGEAELASLPGRIRSAATQAMKYDPGNADARLALISLPPLFRNWARLEMELRGLCEDHPRHWLASGRLAMLLYQVGRLNDGIAFHQRMIAIDPMIAGPYAFAANAMSNAGRVQEAERLLRQAAERWPAHPLLWHVKFNHLLTQGRPQAAAAFLMDPDARPSGMEQDEIEQQETLVRAVDKANPVYVAAVIDHYLPIAQKVTAAIVVAAPIFSLLGRTDLTFASLNRYYLNRGPFGRPSPIAPYARRHTDALFTTAMATGRADPRFERLVRAIGLEAYWRETRTTPDYRRSA